MSIARLATRNLLRAPRRTLLTTVAIVAGVGVFIVGRGFVSGVSEAIIAGAIDGTVGHVLARPAGYPTQPLQHPVDHLLELTPAVRALLDQKTTAWTERTLFAPLAAHGRDALRLEAIGFDPARDALVFPRAHWRIEGTIPERGHAVALSHRVAQLLNVALGDSLILQVRTAKGAINALEVKVEALVTTHNPGLDVLGVFVPHPLVAELIASELPTHLAVKLSDRDDAEAFAADLRAAFNGASDVVTWKTETAELLAVQEIRTRALELVTFILMALAAFGIANTILMAAHERVREVGTLRSMGMTEGGVVRLFLLEGAWMGLIGGVFGALWGGALVAHWATSPLDFSERMQASTRGLSMQALIYTHFDARVIAATIVAGIAVAIVASIYPARIASRMSPAEAVRAS